MANGTVEFFRAQIARIERLLLTVEDERTVRALTDLAKEYEARAAEAERDATAPLRR